MIPPDMVAIELGKAEAEVVKWELRVSQQRERLRGLLIYGPIDPQQPRLHIQERGTSVRARFVG